jgi:23S rRNA pseudoU1915 N3-methylase RlmH
MAKPFSPIKRIDRLYTDSLQLIEKEIYHIRLMCIAEKLPMSAAKDLRDYVKLLAEMKKTHAVMETERKIEAEQKTKNITEEELKKVLEGGGQ